MPSSSPWIVPIAYSRVRTVTRTGAPRTFVVQIIVRPYSFKEFGLQVVQEFPTQWRCLQTLTAGLQQASGNRPVDRRGNSQDRLAGSFDEAAARHTVFQAQRIQHELETEFLPVDFPVFGHMAAISQHGLLHP